MRGKRAKQYRKLMHQYSLSFNFREPYQVLLDAEIIKSAARSKMRLGAMLANTLHGEIKPMITQCCIRHLYDDPTPERDKREWIDVAKQAERRRCGHHELEHPLDPLECISSVVDPKGGGTNRHRYVVASQDGEVRRAMRGIAGVPLVYVSRSVMVLEPMARRTEEVRERDEVGKIRAGLIGRRGAAAGVEKRKREEEEDEAPEKKQKRVRGPKGPNPLSVMKSKKTASATAGKRVEEERKAIRAAMKSDPQAEEKAVDADVAAFEDMDGMVEGQRKRKRKRKPKETLVVGEENIPGGEDDD